MIYLRAIMLFISNTLFRILLFSAISVLTLTHLYTDKTYVLSVLEKNNAYERFIPALLETNKDTSLTSKDSVKLGDEQIRTIFNEAIPPDTIKRSAETIIKSTYAWLEEEQNDLSFSVDLSQNRQKLAEGFADYGIMRATQLPLCESNDIATIDPFSATCVPEGLDLTAERELLIADFLESGNFISDDTITASDFIDSSDQQYERMPLYYKLANIAWLPIGLIILLCGAIVVILSATVKKGLRKLAYGIIGTAVSLIVFTVLFSFILPSFTGSLPILQTSGQGIDALLNDISLTLGRDYAILTLQLCVPLLLFGIILYALTRRKKADSYKQLEKKAGVVNSDHNYRKQTTKRYDPPIQSSDVSITKPARNRKKKKYRTIPKKEI